MADLKKPAPDAAALKGKGKGKQPENDLTEEDLQKKTELDLLVERIKDVEPGVAKLALNALVSELKSSTGSMTGIPKALKFLRPHYESLKQNFETMSNEENKRLLSDILSLLAMTFANEEKRECLKYRLAGNPDELTTWGHEYVRYLAGEVKLEFVQRQEKNESVEDLMALVSKSVAFNMSHNAEADAVDLLLEVDNLSALIQYCDEANYSRVCLYLNQISQYLPTPDDADVLIATYDIYHKCKKLPEALRVALRLADRERIEATFNASDDPLLRKQMAFMLGRQQVRLETGDAQLDSIIGNNLLHEHFLYLARDLDVLEPKAPEDIYKSNADARGAGPAIDSAKQNLASSFVNAFVNAGFGTDKLMTENGDRWIHKNKDTGIISAVASLGAVRMWDVEVGVADLDKYFESDDVYTKAGALLGIGLLSANMRHESDSAFALLSGFVSDAARDQRVCAMLGLGIAYAGTCNEAVLELLLPILADSAQPLEIAAFCSLSLGLIFSGSCNQDLAETIVSTLMEREEKDLIDPLSRFLAVGLGLLFLGRQEDSEAIVETTKALNPKFAPLAAVTINAFAYAGSGNVLKVQELLRTCGEHIEPEQPAGGAQAAAGAPGAAQPAGAAGASAAGGAGAAASNPFAALAAAMGLAQPAAAAPAANPAATAAAEAAAAATAVKNRHQGVAVLGIAMIATGEELGGDMACRTMDHLMQYGDPVIRRAVPLALGLLSVSNPRIQIMDTLTKVSHDSDPETAQSAILALGLIGAGTNNARIAQNLRQLALFYAKEANHLFVVRIAQGLLFTGKGTMTLAPYHSDRFIFNPVAAGGLFIVLNACLDLKNTILGKYHYLLFHLVCSMWPRFLLMVNENLEPVPVSVRVGNAVDTVAQAGRPKTITGAQTHNAPVLLGYEQRAELATEQYLPVSSILENVVLVKNNPNYDA